MVRRPILAASLVLTCAAALSAVGGAAEAAQAPAASPAACTTAQPIEIAALGFQPPAVFPGQSSVATATVVNCTNVAQQVGAEFLGRFVGPGTTLPPGCPVTDPLIESLNLPAGATASASVGYLVPSGCTAVGLVITVDILQQGHVIATRQAELIIK